MTAADQKCQLIIECLVDLDSAIGFRSPIGIVSADERKQHIEALSPSQTIDHSTASRGEQPSRWPLRDTVSFPTAARFCEGLLRSILGSTEIAEVPDEDRDKSSPLLVEDLGDACDGELGAAQPSNSITGRTSTCPNVAFGIFAAHASASSRLATSMT